MVRVFYVTVANADFGSPKYHLLVTFEHYRMIRTTYNFKLFDKKALTISVFFRQDVNAIWKNLYKQLLQVFHLSLFASCNKYGRPKQS